MRAVAPDPPSHTIFDKPIPDLIIHSNGWDGYLAKALFPNSLALELGGIDTPSRVSTLAAVLGRRAPLVLCHLNHSVCAEQLDRLAFLLPLLRTAGGTLWNYGVRDIRKKSLQQGLHAAGMPTVNDVHPAFPGRVIVKTNNNARGKPDARASETSSALHSGAFGAAACADYMVANAADIPSSFWSDEEIAIERFVENDTNEMIRTLVVGRRLVLSVATVEGPVKRWEASTSRRDLLLEMSLATWKGVEEALGGTAAAAFLQVTKFCTEFGLDFGSIDQVFDQQGNVYIVDVNLTPYWGGGGPYSSYRRHLGERANPIARVARALVGLRQAKRSPGRERWKPESLRCWPSRAR
jgi:hypothetical protein